MKKPIRPINIKGIQKALAKHPNVLAGYLTGSQAMGYAGPESDVDIAILLKDPKEAQKSYTKVYLEFYNLLAEFAESTLDERDLDLVFLQTLPVQHQYHALHEGKRIYTANSERVLNYEEYIYNQYADLKPYFDTIIGEYIHTVAHA
ncbi:hypothetical protein B5M47_03610 [candidate division CPR3 bacterium 4484_211]|uniref:Polymerase beta nucleotidyltransferase domain-containing protein n=1 Tax=candidate division CPR3 bacterium 4484_211 TaxID=1968527 RepID=A0A1W9NWZ5_UNCC3|nr:MAG: hypothetical protein B5M47_03610 [candidate division CPR3 bacterium 4484_211]HDN74358.1 nucleotidyltransferase domain-containing protein [Archaeoglobus sp.]